MTNDFLMIKEMLEKVGLYDDKMKLLTNNKLYFQGEVDEKDKDIFKTKAALSLFIPGKYTLEYSKQGDSLKASNDDAAMMFGYRVKCYQNINEVKYCGLVKNQGMVVSGRYASELVASAILLEKMCKTEILSKNVGKIYYHNPLMAFLEHLIYKVSYSKKEKKKYEQGK